jgi:tRNA threonylcarbamoyladenosine biosynthesis protein TsaE
LGLYGELGAGKTTFMKYFARFFGIEETIQSPTFVIEKIYKLENQDFDHLVHIDAYRLEDSNELEILGWSDIVKNPRNIVCIEWADRVETLLPKEKIVLRFSHHDEESRMIDFHG